jgi:hypothetical protein
VARIVHASASMPKHTKRVWIVSPPLAPAFQVGDTFHHKSGALILQVVDCQSADLLRIERYDRAVDKTQWQPVGAFSATASQLADVLESGVVPALPDSRERRFGL